jgi:MFS family permease
MPSLGFIETWAVASLLLFVVLSAVVTLRLLDRLGVSRAWMLALLLMNVGLLIVLARLAFGDLPKVDGPNRGT